MVLTKRSAASGDENVRDLDISYILAFLVLRFCQFDLPFLSSVDLATLN